jgi:hypothetical protein
MDRANLEAKMTSQARDKTRVLKCGKQKMRKLNQKYENSVVYVFFLPFRERRGELQRRSRSSGSSDGGQDKKEESIEGVGELHAMKVRHELTVIISN